MEYRQLGRTGLRVSAVAMGCVEIGQDYGICVPGDFGKPDEKSSIELIRMAVDSGVNLFDTAPSYGDSEKVLGDALRNQSNCYIATKVNIPPEGRDVFEFINTSINQSCRNLKRECLDVVQIHNATVDTIRHSDIPEILLRLRREGKIKFIGASVYEVKNALEVIRSSCFDVLQIAYNVLDQRMAKEVLSLALNNGVGIIVRSSYLKGILTPKVRYLPPECAPLKKYSEKIKEMMNIPTWEELASFALRFCLSNPDIDSVIVGIRTKTELEAALDVEEKGQLPEAAYEEAQKLGLKDEYRLNPANWPIP